MSRGAQSHSPKSIAARIYNQDNPLNLRQTGMQFNSISANNNYETSHRADSSNGYHQPAMAATFMGQRMYNVRNQ